MDFDFYTNVSLVGDGILYRGIRNGKDVSRVDQYHPTLFLGSKEKTKFRTLDGKYVEPIVPGTISECREFVQRYEGVPNFTIYGNTDYVYQYIGDYFPNEVHYDLSNIPICYIDIETTCERGFPKVDDPEEQVIAITVAMLGETHVFGLGNFTTHKAKTYSYNFHREEDLLESFLSWWEERHPHVVTGWNIKFFDIPYLVSRIRRVLRNKTCS